MLQAIADDLSQVPNCRVVTTLDACQQRLSVTNVEVIRVADPEEEADRFQKLAADADACLIIAPELGNVLFHRCETASRAGARRILNPARNIVELCSDKLRLCEFLVEHSIPTIPTAVWPAAPEDDAAQLPIVVKPRFGAGSQDVYVFESVASARQAIPPPAADNRNPVDERIVQPLVSGIAVSVGVICGSRTGATTILPAATQNLSSDGRFRYLGGRIPWDGRRAAEVRDIVERTCRLMPGLAGYVGFDLVVPYDASQPPTIVEINPRLTTSYLGYRQLAEENLGERLISETTLPMPVRWKRGSVAFLPDGRLENVSGDYADRS